MDTKFLGEHLLPGQFGHFFVVLAFVSSLVATIAYFQATRAVEAPSRQAWRKLARGAFGIQVGAIFAVFIILYYIIANHFFEYKYVWQHSSKALPLQYLLSCFWEGQEGSFLLWSIWNSVLGGILIFRSKDWELPVMTVMSFAQCCLSSMLLGIFFFNYKVGSSPFVLLRNEMQGAPIFARADYLNFITDGRGLNELLQNYWMVIHPPVLFLGFASTIIPFAYAVAGLWTKRFGEWVKPAQPWALFSAAVLGTGIMMGAAWAYESLTFGGYWAWDPVENASLVPWLTLVAGVHTLMIYRATGHSLRATFFFFIISFVLILYSTFLTRSGILGDTSVHSFTDLGMSGQLVIYLLIFLIPAFVLFFRYYRQIPSTRQEESLHSREFWMFIGSLVLLIAALQVSFTTSIPVWNKLFGSNMAPPTDPEFHYNKIQVLVAILIGIGTGAIQFFKYKQTSLAYFAKKIAWPSSIAFGLSLLIAWAVQLHYNKYGLGFQIALYILLFASLFAIVGNGFYLFGVLKGKWRVGGAAVAHIGFGMMLLGILISSAKKEVISVNRLGIDFNFGEKSKEDSRENILLYKNIPMQMGPYLVTYAGDSTVAGDPKHYYTVRYVRKDTSTQQVFEQFTLYPDAFIKDNGLIANPDSKHYWNHDVFTYVTSVVDPSKKQDTARYVSHLVQVGDSVFLSNGYMILENLVPQPRRTGYQPQPGDIAVGAQLKVYTKDQQQYQAVPIYFIRDSVYQNSVEDTVAPLSLYVRFSKILPREQKIELQVKQSNAGDDYIIMKAYVFPYINILWLGVIVMATGFGLSIRQRLLQKK